MKKIFVIKTNLNIKIDKKEIIPKFCVERKAYIN
jgi:hypothetical protein